MPGIRGVYLAYPIDQRGPASLGYLFQQIERLKVELIEEQVVSWVFDPGDAFRVDPRRPDAGVATINRAALNNADVVVAFLPADVASIGVPMEVDRARAMGKHVIVVSDAKSFMLEMPGIFRVRDYDVPNMDAVFQYIAALEPPEDNGRAPDDLRVKVEREGCLPRRAYDDDAGLDLVVSRDTTIRPGTFEDVPCGVSVELPEWSWGLVTGRSSALRKRGLLVHSGVIDAGYRGPLFAGAWNMTDEPVTVKQGERIAQLIVLSNMTRHVLPLEVEQLSASARGTGGFGSTGA